MKAVPLLFACAAGLAAGALAGRTFHPARLAKPPTATASDDPALAAPRGANAPRAAASATIDDRIARLFTALKEPVQLARDYELREALRDLPASEFPKLVERAEKVPPELRNDFAVALTIAWFDADPAAASRWMQTHPEWQWGVEAWAREDPGAAIGDAFAAPERSRSKKALFSAIEKLAGKGPAAMAALLRELPAGGVRDAVFADVLKRWAQTDPAAAFAAVAEMAPGGARDDARKQAVLAWANRDPAAALAQIPAMLPSLSKGVLGSDFLAELADRIMQKNPRLALDWLGALPAEYRSAPAIAGLGVWAKKEPAAALDWCLAHGVEVARWRRMGFNMGGAGVLAEAMKSAPAATVAWLEARPAGPDRDRLIERALADAIWYLSEEEFTANEGNLQMRLFHQLPEDAQIETAVAFGHRHAELSTFTDLGAWAQRFAPGPARAEAITAAIGSAYYRDASRIDALLAGVSPGADRDAALRGLATQLGYSTPAAAATRALEIGNDTVRRATLDKVMTRWLKNDPEASRAWLQESGAIPAAWKQEWLRAR